MASVNKSKVLEAAQKQVAKGNLDKALKEYQKILKADANDTGVRLKTGELHERMGDRAQALAEYRRVASTFTAQGFYSKAVAVLKRIQHADPNQIEIHLELAELNEKLGLLSEVVHHYQLAANVYDRKGEKRAAIDILKKVSEVGQSNLERKIKVAELYYKEGFPDAGYEQFVHSIADIDDQSPDLVEIAVRMCKASPEDPKLIERLGSIYLGQGQAKLAIEAFERARAIAEEPSTVELLALAKLQVDLPGEARTLFEKAAALYEASGIKHKAREVGARATELAEQALDGAETLAGGGPEGTAPAGGPSAQGDAAGTAASEPLPRPEEAVEGPETAEEPPPPADEAGAERESESEAATTSAGYEVTIEGAPAPTAAASESVEDPGEEDLSEDERLEVAFSKAEVYRKYGKMDGAVRVLSGTAKKFPHRHEPRIRLKEIYEATGDWAEVADQCRMLSLIASNRGDDLRSKRFLEEATRALARLAGGGAVEAPGAEAGGPDPEVTARSEETEVAVQAPGRQARPEPEEPAPSLDIRIDDESLGEEAPPPELDSGQDAPPDPLAAIEDMLIRPDAFRPGDAGATGAAAEEPDDGLLDLELVIDDEGANPSGTPLSAEVGAGVEDEPVPGLEPLPPEIAAAEDSGPEPGAIEADAIDLTAAELLASQDKVAEALSIYARAVDAWPQDESIRARYESLLERLAPAGIGETSDVEEREDPAAFASGEESACLEPESGAIEDDAEAGEEDIGEAAGERAGEEEIVILDEMEEESPSWDWVPTNGRLSTSNQLGGPAHHEREPSIDEASRTGEAEEESPEEASFSSAVAEPEPAAPGEAEAPFLEAPVGAVETAEHSAFDLRAELEEDPDAPDAIGDVSDATEALSDLVTELQREEQQAVAGLDARTHYDLGVAYKEMGLLDDAIRELSIAAGDPARRVECCEVIGICYREQGRPEEAVRMLEECLGDGSIAEESAPGLLYEMATAQEAMGNLGKALDWYERVLEIDPHFSDVSERMASLRAGPGADAGDPGKRPDGPFDDEGIADIEEMLDDLETDS